MEKGKPKKKDRTQTGIGLITIAIFFASWVFIDTIYYDIDTFYLFIGIYFSIMLFITGYFLIMNSKK